MLAVGEGFLIRLLMGFGMGIRICNCRSRYVDMDVDWGVMYKIWIRDHHDAGTHAPQLCHCTANLALPFQLKYRCIIKYNQELF